MFVRLDVLDLRGERVVLQVPEQEPGEAHQDRGPLARHVPGPGSLQEQQGLCSGLQLPPRLTHEPGQEVRGLVIS